MPQIYNNTFRGAKWMLVKGHPFYSISDKGDIFSFKRNRKLNPYSNRKGYLQVQLDGKTYSVHRLVLTNFSEMDCCLQVNHINSIKSDNRLCNLEWVTNQQNSDHSWLNGRKAARGSKQGSSKLNEKQVKDIKFLLKAGKTQKHISEMYGVSRSTIGKISSGKNWGWVG